MVNGSGNGFIKSLLGLVVETKLDPHADNVAAKKLITGRMVVLAGEFFTHLPGFAEKVLDEIPAVVRKVIRETGYTGKFLGLDHLRPAMSWSIKITSAMLTLPSVSGSGREPASTPSIPDKIFNALMTSASAGSGASCG